MTTQLLLDEPPLLVLPSLAVTVGLNEAIILQQIHFWLKVKEKDPARYPRDRRAGADGAERWWVYNSVRQWQEQFPFWGDNTIQRALASLKAQGVLRVEHLADDPRDRTNWYSIDYPALAALTGAAPPAPRPHYPKLGQRIAPRQGSALPQNGVMGSPQFGAMHDPVLGRCLKTETPSENTQRIPQRAPAAPGVSPSSLSEGKEPEGSAPGAPEGTGPREKTGPGEGEPEPREAAQGPEPAWRAAYRSLSDRERQGWGRKATLQAAALGIRASDVPAISRLARELFREHFREQAAQEHAGREQRGEGGAD